MTIELTRQIFVRCFCTAENGAEVNLVDSLLAIARSIDGLSRAIHKLGMADAATPMGAIEAHSLEIKQASERISEAISGLADTLGGSNAD